MCFQEEEEEEAPRAGRSLSNLRPVWILQPGNNPTVSGSFPEPELLQNRKGGVHRNIERRSFQTHSRRFRRDGGQLSGIILAGMREKPGLSRPAYLLVWVDVDVALDALLAHVGPGVAAHPLPLTLGALVLSEAPLLALVGRQSFAFGPGLGRNTHNKLEGSHR